MSLLSMAAKAGGNIVGGIGNMAYTDAAKGNVREGYNKAIGNIQSTQSQNTSAYSPYLKSGTTGITGYTSNVQNRQQSTLPTLQTTTAEGTASYLDPSADYTIDQSNKAIQASALAKGGLGGGLAKALSTNASKLAMTNYNNAFQQQLAANNQNFGQQQQQYTNNENYQNQLTNNWQNLASLGSQNLGNYTTQNNQLSQALSDYYVGKGQSIASLNQAQGNNWNNLFTNATSLT